MRKHKLFIALLLVLLLLYPSRQAITAWTGANFDRSVYGASYGMVCNGVKDDTAAFQAAVNAVGTAERQNKLVLPPGNCIISSTVTFGNTVNYFMTGAGSGLSSTKIPTVLTWNGNATTCMLLMNATRDSQFENFGIQSTASAPLACGIGSETSANGNGTHNKYMNIMMNGTNSGGLLKGFQFFVGSGGTDANNDNNVFIDVFITNFTTAAWSFEHQQSKAHHFYDCSFEGISATSSSYGVTTTLGTGTQGGSFWWRGGSGGLVGVDFALGAPNDSILISDWTSEGSGQLLTTPNLTGNVSVTLEAVRFADNAVVSPYQIINFGLPCCLVIIGGQIGGGNNPIQIELSHTGDAGAIRRATIIGAQLLSSSATLNFFNCQATASGCDFATQGNMYNNTIPVPDTFGHGPAITTSAIGAGCGTGSPTITGDMNVFRLTCGTTAGTSWTITWPFTRTNVPTCSVTPETAAASSGMSITANSTTTLSVGWTTSTAGTVWDVRCDGV